MTWPVSALVRRQSYIASTGSRTSAQWSRQAHQGCVGAEEGDVTGLEGAEPEVDWAQELVGLATLVMPSLISLPRLGSST